jgi:hypothetical protein
MARSSAQLNEVPADTDTEAPFGRKPDGTPRKRAASEGPRTITPLMVMYRAVDANGQKVEGVQLEVIYAGRDHKTVNELRDEYPDAKVTKVKPSKSE